MEIRVRAECRQIQTSAEFSARDLVVKRVQRAELFYSGHRIPKAGGAQGLHLRTWEAVDEERRRGGGLQGEEEVMALAGPRCALLQFFRGEGGVDGIRQASAVGLCQAYQLGSGHFVGG